MSQNSVSESPRAIGYARVSTDDQRLSLQLDALQQRGCERIFEDAGISGWQRCRPGLEECLTYLHPGDVLVVWRLDRLGRSLQHLLDIVTALNERGIGLVSLSESIDTTSASGRLVFSIFGGLAEYERSMIAERVRPGMRSAKRRGVQVGRRPALTPSRRQLAQKLVADGETPTTVARLLQVGRSTVYRALRDTRQLDPTQGRPF